MGNSQGKTFGFLGADVKKNQNKSLEIEVRNSQGEVLGVLSGNVKKNQNKNLEIEVSDSQGGVLGVCECRRPKTANQILGDKGEELVRTSFGCFKCKHKKTLKCLVQNFRCADLICEFCGHLSQVKTSKVNNIDVFPKSILSSSWPPIKKRMDAGIFYPIYFVLISKKNEKEFSIFYLPVDFQNESMYKKRPPLGPDAKRAGWLCA